MGDSGNSLGEESVLTLAQLADDYSRIGRKLTEMEKGNHSLPFPRGMMDADCAAGAAAIICYLRDLFTATDNEHWSRDKILVVLETVSQDPELFPCGIGAQMWDMEVGVTP